MINLISFFLSFFTPQGSDVEKATDWIFSNNAAGSSDMDATSSTTSVDAALPDGGGS